MSRRPTIKFTYANVIATLALFIALGGTGVAEPARQFAAKLVTGKQIKNGTVAEVDLSKDVRTKLAKTGSTGPSGATGPAGAAGATGAAGSNATVDGIAAGGALTGTFPAPGLADGSVGAAQLSAASVTSSALAPDAVTTPGIANGAVTVTKVGTGAINGAKVLNGSLGKGDVGTTVLAAYDGPSIPSGACDDFAIPVPTGLDDPIAAVDPPTNFFTTPGLVVSWSIGISDGDLKIYVCNVTAAAINPANGNWRAVLFH